MIFLENKYTSTYYNIIYRAKSRPEIMSYTEKHHIVPKSLGGSNGRENLVVLTAREHFICHMLLVRMTENNNRYKMVHAAIGMKRSRSYQPRYINSRLYETLKKEFAIISSNRNKGKSPSVETRLKMSIAGKGKQKSAETKMKMSIAATGKSNGPMSDNEKLKRSVALRGRESPNKGNRYILTTSQKAKISASNKRRILSPETKLKIAEGLRRYQKSKQVK